MKAIGPILCAALASQVSTVLAAPGDAQRGAQLFRQCMSCHSTEPGVHMTGPSLAHAWGSKAASAEGFHRYSDELKRSGLVWNEAALDAWLADPAKLVPGTSMTFPGIKHEKARQDIIAYLKAVAEDKAPAAGEGSGAMMGGGGMKGMGGRRPDLKTAPAAGQVRSIKHCGDTYTIETGDGKTEKIWEYNLRFKTDSSKLGPAPGKPVAIGAGMRGDRASVVFASPAEISESVKESCP